MKKSFLWMWKHPNSNYFAGTGTKLKTRIQPRFPLFYDFNFFKKLIFFVCFKSWSIRIRVSKVLQPEQNFFL